MRHLLAFILFAAPLAVSQPLPGWMHPGGALGPGGVAEGGCTNGGYTGTGLCVRATSPTIASPTFTGTVTGAAANWSGQVTSTSDGGGSASSGFKVSSASAASMAFNVTGAAADNRLWDINTGGVTFNIRAVNDANSAAATAMTITRSGTSITEIAFLAPVSGAAANWSGAQTFNAGANFTGTLTAEVANFSSTVTADFSVNANSLVSRSGVVHLDNATGNNFFQLDAGKIQTAQGGVIAHEISSTLSRTYVPAQFDDQITGQNDNASIIFKNGAGTLFGGMGTSAWGFGDLNNDLAILATTGKSIRFGADGAQKMVLSPSLLTVAVPAQFDLGVQIVGGSSGLGTIWKDGTDGLSVRGAVGSANDFVLLNRDGVPVIRNPATTNSVDFFDDVTIGSTITTAAPTAGTAAPWKLGTVSVTSPTSPNRTIEVEVGGTTYYISAKTTND